MQTQIVFPCFPNNTINNMTHGKISLILGPMFAGKTSSLIRRYRRYTVAGKRCLLVKHINDTRYDSEQLCTHDLHKIEAKSCFNLHELWNLIDNYDVICVDEIQFYPDNLEFAEKVADLGKIIVASGLSGNFRREPFKNIPELTAKADQVTYLTAVCMVCKEEGAAFTKRISDEQDEVVSGAEKYIAVCRQCY